VLLTDLLTIDRIKIPLESRTKDEVLLELVGVIANGSGGEPQRLELLRAVREREAVLSTGIGNGVAIPHGKSSVVPELRMAAGTVKEPVEFDALDGQPVRLLFLLVGPESAAGPHIKALSRIARLIRNDDVRKSLLAARNPADFLQALKQAESI
jgi:mannitol/fructose-specific phosphotransferase system IIA component (Ntr-type)